MAASIRMAAGVYGRCDTCMRNLYKQICALNCSPKQSDFLVPTNGSKEKDDKTGNGRWKKLQNPQSLQNYCSAFWIFAVTVVASVDYYISEAYVDGVFDSCKNVIMPATGGFVIDTSCKPYDSKSCTPKRFVSWCPMHLQPSKHTTFLFSFSVWFFFSSILWETLSSTIFYRFQYAINMTNLKSHFMLKRKNATNLIP